MSMLVAGRIVQGIGAAGANMLIEIIIADLVPLRQRGAYLALLFGLVAIGTALGPFLGGLIVSYSWRWVFYLNLPIGGVALGFLFMFLRVKWNKTTTMASNLSRIDWLGNIIFVATISSILIALSWGGAKYPWSSYNVLVPLIIGFFGIAGFLVLQGSPRLTPNPTMPLRLLGNRTSAVAFVLTFLHSIAAMWVLYFLPIYFQGVLGSSTTRSGVQLLPSILTLIPFGALGGGLLTKFGRYMPIHFAGFAIMLVGIGLLTLIDEDSSTGAWVGFQIIESAGAGVILATLLPAVMAPLAEADVAQATATWSFVRSFGLTWGSAIPAAVFNSRFDMLAKTHIDNQELREQLSDGRAYEHATKMFRDTLSQIDRDQFSWTVNESLQRGWQVAIAFAALGLLVVAFEKEVPLRKELETEYGMDDAKEK